MGFTMGNVRDYEEEKKNKKNQTTKNITIEANKRNQTSTKNTTQNQGFTMGSIKQIDPIQEDSNKYNKLYEQQKKITNEWSKVYNKAQMNTFQKYKIGIFTDKISDNTYKPEIKPENYLENKKRDEYIKQNQEKIANGQISIKPGTNTYSSPFDAQANKEKMELAKKETKPISDILKKEQNTLKYAEYLKNVEDISKEDTTWWDKTGGNVTRALKDSLSFLAGDKYTYKDENGKTVYLPTRSDIKQQKVSEDYDTGVGKFLGDVTYGGTKILSSIGIDALTGTPAGTVAYWSDMVSDGYKGAINQGYDEGSSLAYSLVNAGYEYAVGKFLGGATGKLTGGSARALDNAVGNVANKFVSKLTSNPELAAKISRIIGTGVSEGSEELVQEYLDNISRILILEKGNLDLQSVLSDEDIFGDAMYSAAVGAATGALVEGSNKSNVDSNVKMFSTFKEQLEERIKNTTDTETKKKYQDMIDNINTYLDKPFTIDPSSLDETVEEINNLPEEQNTPNSSKNTQNDINIPTKENTSENGLNMPINDNTNIEENTNINLPTNEDVDPTENLIKYQEKIIQQQETRKQELQQEQIDNMSKKIDKLSKQVQVQNENAKGTPFNTLIGYGNDTALVQVKGDLQNINGVDVGIYKDSNGNWHVVDLQSNFSLDRANYSTKKAAIENATDAINNFDLSQLRQNREQRKAEAIDLTTKNKPETKNEYRGSHQIENAKKLVDLNINDIQSRVKELNGYLTQQDQADLRKLHKIFNHPEEDIKVYRASPVNELNSGDWITTDKAYAKNVAQNNGGKVYEHTIKPSQLYYPDNINELPSLHRLSSFQYVENKPSIPTTNKGNIPIKEELYQKYPDYKSIFNGERNNYDGNIEVNEDISGILDNYDLSNMKSAKEAAINVFNTFHKNNIFTNDGNKIEVSKDGVRESIQKIFESEKQRNLIKEHMQVFSDLGDIIEHADLVGQASNTKPEERPGVNSWNYYFDGLNINGKKYSLEFEVRSMDNGNNQYRVQRLEPKVKTTNSSGVASNNTRNLPPNESVVSINNNNTTSQKSQISLPTKQKAKETSKQELNLPKNPTKESSYETEPKKKTQKEAREELKEEMNITLDDIEAGKDISSLEFQRTDPIRLNEKVFGAEIGQKINDATINKTKHNEAERTRFLNKERDEIKKLNIKPRSKESAAVQKYGEKQYINDKGEVVKYGDKELATEFKDETTQKKIKHAAEVLRNKYDRYIDEINESITKMGYDPIPKRPDYMRHFQEINDKLSQWGIPLNPTDLSKDSLPTDINGITDQFKPGKNWFASAMQRKGFKTTYDAITGIDGYLEGASNLIYHTEDIQRYRALSKLIRDTYGQTHGMDNIDPSTEEGQKRLNDIFDNKLSKYAAWIDEQANALAGKKGGIDRAAERLLGRKIYTVLDTAKKQVGSNMTGFNVRSAMTNFASAVQGASKTNKLAWIRGTLSTINNIIHNDGLINKSDFLTSRFGSDMLSKKLWQKASNAGQIFMTGTDYFTANQIWRSKYYENLSKGMSESQAIKKADDFASRIMGDRSKGATAEIFNSKTLGLLTQFQLEVNNQWSSIIHDNKIDIKTGNKSGATVMFQLGQLAALSYLFNNIMKSLTGSDVMIDPIDMMLKMIGDDDDDDKTIEERAKEVLGDLVNDIPFASFMTGGRIPMSEAFKGASSLFKYATNQKDKYGNDIKWDDVKKDLIESGYYWLLPTGYGQIRKTKEGLSMYDNKLPVPGSYTDSGNLRFEADTSTGGKIQSALFGQYASKNAREYFDKGYVPLKPKQIEESKKYNMNIPTYRDFSNDLKEAQKTSIKIESDDDKNYYWRMYKDNDNNWYWYNEKNDTVYKTDSSIFNEKNLQKTNLNVDNLIKVTQSESTYDYIMNMNIPTNQKATILNNELDRKTKYTEKDLESNYASLEEMDYAIKNPGKYSVITQIAPYSKYTQYQDEINKIKKNTKNDKAEVIEYINNLRMSVPQKAMFIKQYYSSFKQYDREIAEYIANQNLTIKEKQKILNQLGFTIKDGRVYY